jgi:hypothetical protein
MNTCYIQVDLKLPDMKTKVFFLICLFAVVGLSRLSAQPDNKKGTGTVIDYPELDLDWPVYCNGVMIDDLVGTITFHRVRHYVDGILVTAMGKGSGVALSTSGSNEEFVVTEIDQRSQANETFSIIKFNLIGNKGSHYIETFLLNNETGGLTFVKGICIL